MDLDAVNEGGARGRLMEPEEEIDRGRLPGAVGAQQTDDLPAVDLQVEVAQCLDVSKPFTQIPC